MMSFRRIFLVALFFCGACAILVFHSRARVCVCVCVCVCVMREREGNWFSQERTWSNES